jgi:putative membrane protein
MFENIGNYAAFLGASLALLLAAVTVYVMVTPLHEVRLIRQGNTAASLSLGGAVIGLALTLFGVASSTFVLMELVAWGAVGVALQVAAYVIISFVLPDYRHKIENNQASYGIAGAAFSIAVGILNAGAIAG